MFRLIANIVRLTGRSPRLVFVALVAAILSIVAVGVYSWSGYHFRAAAEANARNDLAEAQSHINLCLLVRFRSCKAQLLAAQISRRRDDYAESERHLAACEQLGDGPILAVRERLLLAAQQGDLDGIERLLGDRTEQDNTEAVLILEALAKGYASRFWYAEALARLDSLLERQPRHHQALLLRAEIEEHQASNGFPERELDALRDFEKAIQINPSFEARQGLAGVYFRLGRPWDALLEYEKLRQEKDDSPEVLLALARCRFNLHAVEQARQLLDGLLARFPDYAGGCLERGQLALHLGQLSEAAKWLARAIHTNPHDAEALRLFVQTLDIDGKSDEASRYRQRLAEEEMKLLEVNRMTLQANRDPQNVPLRYKIAQKLKQLGREQEFVAALYLVLEQAPQHAAARRDLADYLERQQQWERAARYRDNAAQ